MSNLLFKWCIHIIYLLYILKILFGLRIRFSNKKSTTIWKKKNFLEERYKRRREFCKANSKKGSRSEMEEKIVKWELFNHPQNAMKLYTRSRFFSFWEELNLVEYDYVWFIFSNEIDIALNIILFILVWRVNLNFI